MTSGTGVRQVEFIEALVDFITTDLSGAFQVEDVAAEAGITSYATLPGITGMLSDAQLTLSMGAGPDCYFSITTGEGSGKSTPYSGWIDARERMRMIPHLSYTPGVKITSQPGSPNNDDVMISLPSIADSNLTFDYWIFGDDDVENYIHAIFRISADYWQHFSLGRAARPSGVNGGWFMGGTSDLVTDANSDWDAVTLGADLELGSILGLRTGGNGAQCAWIQGHNHPTSLIAANLNNWYKYRDSSGEGLPLLTSYLPAHTNLMHVGSSQTASGFYRVHHGRTKTNAGNAVSPIVPCNFFMPKAELAAGARVFAFFGRLPNAFYVDITNMEPGGDLVVGSDTYFVFPALGGKNVSHPFYPDHKNWGVAILKP